MIKQQQTLSKSFANGGHTFILLLNYQIHLHHSLVILCYPQEGYQFSGYPRKRNIPGNYTPFIYHMQEQNEQGGY